MSSDIQIATCVCGGEIYEGEEQHECEICGKSLCHYCYEDPCLNCGEHVCKNCKSECATCETPICTVCGIVYGSFLGDKPYCSQICLNEALQKYNRKAV